MPKPKSQLTASSLKDTRPASFREIGDVGLPVAKLLFTRREASAALAISSKTLARLEARGLITSLKALRTKLYTRESLLNFIEEAK